MNVLSLFDGISCAKVALERAGVPVARYSACEIDKHAIAISIKNHPDSVRMGDVREVTGLTNVDLLIGGSPCQDLSIAKKERKGLDGDRSGLFWEYVRILREVKPTWFILENVASMPKKDKDIITAELGVEPVMFDASLVSAQSRKRLFWTNIPFDLPTDKGIVLKDILQPDAEVDESMMVKGKTFTESKGYTGKIEYIGEGKQNGQGGQAHRVYSTDGKTPTLSSGAPLIFAGYVEGGLRKGMEGQAHLSRAHRNPNRVYDPEGKAPTLSASETSGRNLIKIGHVGNTDGQGNRVYSPDGKSCTLSALGGGSGAKTGLYAIGRDVGRRLNAEGHREDNNQDIPIQRRVELRTDDKTGTLTSVQKDNLVVSETCIRKLTPVECERLQGLPDGYTDGIAKTNRYKCLGNAFNVDVVAHIVKHLA